LVKYESLEKQPTLAARPASFVARLGIPAFVIGLALGYCYGMFGGSF